MSAEGTSVRCASARTRVLAYGLLACCAAMILFGPLIAEWSLRALGCPAGWSAAVGGCRGLAALPADGLLPWLSRTPPVETLFLLWDQVGLWLVGWLGLVVLSRHLDRRRPVRLSVDGPGEPGATNDAPRDPNFASRQARWIQEREAEQAEALRLGQLSLHRRMLAEGAFWAVLSIALLVSVSALVVFCLAFGTPLVGGLSADSVLSSLSCGVQTPAEAHLLSETCGFWRERLAPYQQPWIGALLAPLWLFTQFSDVLLGWIAVILAVALAPALRFGWSAMLKQTPAWLRAGIGVMVAMALASLLLDLSWSPTPASSRDYTLGGIGMLMPALFMIGVAALLALTGGLIALIVLVIALARRFGRSTNEAGQHAPTRPENRPTT